MPAVYSAATRCACTHSMATSPLQTVDPDLLAAAGEQGHRHYLRSIATMVDQHNVVTQEAIYTGEGVKLIEKGARIDSGMYVRLIRHKLRGRVENQLTVDNAVTPESIVALAQEQCTSAPLLRAMTHPGPAGIDIASLLAPLHVLTLPKPLAFMLTVIREQHPCDYIHGIQVALVAVYLALRSGWSKAECTPLMAAGLLHDIGVLYMDPVWHDTTRRITGAGRRHLIAHPVTAALLLRDHGGYPDTVAQAIMEHHERMDGSGYPRGLHGNAISPMGQILLVAEVVSAFFEKYTNDDVARRLWLSLRLGHHKYPSAFTQLLQPVLQNISMPTAPHVEPAQVQHAWQRIADALQSWQDLSADLPRASAGHNAKGAGDAFSFVDQRINALQRSLFDAGTHPHQQAELLTQIEEDAQGLQELLLLAREALWQLQIIANAVSNRWPELAQSAAPGNIAVTRWRDALFADDTVSEEAGTDATAP